ncbi:RHS repeat-associated core domain-containing protein [Xenorhabdus innexi]|uniref:YD repeat n=2 Tax=Xenorhabdus innexi TaxID=290109 RepID=A0A1N6MX84_9GAMM|nr:RHS repeat-associated core domain-containing protein [Xenorhabdus innexi]PHM30359.1 YD repeat [Xenorhabdus innexi]SIP73440.1 hypothetical protein XIS1_210024 [Xenorhabdus innexi]
MTPERRLTQLTAPDGKSITQYAYDVNGNRNEIKIATDNPEFPFLITTTQYNVANKPLSVTEPDGKTTTIQYDLLNRIDTVTSSSGRRTRTTYDPASRPVEIIDELANEHDASITRNLGAVVRETRNYSIDGFLEKLTDANKNTTTYKLDAFGRQSQTIYPDGSDDLHALNAMGREVGFQRRDKSQIWYEYDNLDRLISKKTKNQPTIRYDYDYSGHILSLTPSVNPEFAVSYTYDTAGRITSETTALFGTTQFVLDNNGNRVSMTLPPRVGGINVTNIYDTLNRITGVYQDSSTTALPIVNYTYDPTGRRTRAVYGDLQNPLAETTLNYNQASLPTTINHKWNGSQLNIGYQYNADRQKTRVTLSDKSFAPPALPDSNQTYKSNHLNQYTTINNSTPEYDKRGNLIKNGEWSYRYDTENKLISADKANIKLEFGYDALNRRITKKVTKDNAVTTYSYLSVGDQEMAMLSDTGPAKINNVYIYGAGLDEVVADITPRGQNFYFQDALGSTIALTNAKGEVIEKHGYTSYGLESSSGNNNAAFRFAGRRIDPETGLSYNRTRYYSPTLGRFLQTDPAGMLGGLNLYAYTGNDPVNFVDPTGQWGEVTNLVPGNQNMGTALESFNAGHYWDAGLYAGSAIGEALLTVATGGLSRAEGLVTQGGKAIAELPIIQRGMQGIYEFVAKSGKTYVGQSSDILKRLEQHFRSGKLLPGTPIKTTPVPGGKLQREIAEQKRIDDLGGVWRGNLENRVNPIGPKRRHLMEKADK